MMFGCTQSTLPVVIKSEPPVVACLAVCKETCQWPLPKFKSHDWDDFVEHYLNVVEGIYKTCSNKLETCGQCVDELKSRHIVR